MIYYLALIVILMLAYVIVRPFKRARFFYLTIAFLALSALACFRDISVGTDTEQYMTTYKTIGGVMRYSEIRLGQVYEPGYMAYIITLNKISKNPRLLEIVSFLFINFAVLRFIHKNSKNYFISTLIYVMTCQYLASMCMMRQFLSISIVLLGINALTRGKYFRFFLLILLATSFHYFAAMFILLPIFKGIRKFSIPQLVLIGLIFIPIYLLLPKIIMKIITTITNYGDYMSYLKETGEINGTLRFPPMLIILLVVLFPFLFNIKNLYYNDEIIHFDGKDYGYLNIIFIFLACLILLAGRFALFTRFYYYFTPFMLLAPNLYCKKENDPSWNLYYILILTAAFVFCLATGSGTYGAESFKFGTLS